MHYLESNKYPVLRMFSLDTNAQRETFAALINYVIDDALLESKLHQDRSSAASLYRRHELSFGRPTAEFPQTL